MIMQPNIGQLLKKADSRYTLVIMAAKRAREIGDSGECLVPCESNKPIGMAVSEINEGLVHFDRGTSLKQQQQEAIDKIELVADAATWTDSESNEVSENNDTETA